MRTDWKLCWSLQVDLSHLKCFKFQRVVYLEQLLSVILSQCAFFMFNVHSGCLSKKIDDVALTGFVSCYITVFR